MFCANHCLQVFFRGLNPKSEFNSFESPNELSSPETSALKKGWQFSGPRNKKMADLAKSQGLDALLATSSENFAYPSGLTVPSYKC